MNELSIDMYILKNSIKENKSIKQIRNNFNGCISSIKESNFQNLKNDVLLGNGNYIMIVETSDKINNKLISNYYKLSRNNLGCIISPNKKEQFKINGKLVPRDHLKKYIKENNIEHLNKYEFYKFLLSENIVVSETNQYTSYDNKLYKFWEYQFNLKNNLFDCINSLEKIEKFLKQKSIINKKDEYKQIYLEEITSQYKNIFFSPLVSQTSKEYILGILYCIVNAKFDECDTFMEFLSNKIGYMEEIIDQGGYKDLELKDKFNDPKIIKKVLKVFL